MIIQLPKALNDLIQIEEKIKLVEAKLGQSNLSQASKEKLIKLIIQKFLSQ